MEPWWKFAGFFLNLSTDYDRNQAFSHFWSLCIEEHFYLIFPVLAWLVIRESRVATLTALFAAVVLAGIVLRTEIWLHDATGAPQRNWFVEDIYYPTWNRLDGLLAGVALAWLKAFRPERWRKLARLSNWALLIGLLTLSIAVWLFWDRTGLIGNSIGWPVLSCGLGLLVFAGAQQSSWLGRQTIPGAAWIAAVSTGAYGSTWVTFPPGRFAGKGRVVDD
jgi:peptidoglycan/LPS O-acetylase OafA/YrhL